MISKTLLLAGSGEFTQPMQSVDSYVLSFADPKNRKVTILPTASGLEADYKKWVDMGSEHFKLFGYDVYVALVLNRKDAENKAIVDEIKGSALIYFSGGDPGHLIRSIKDTYLQTVINELYLSGVILAGCSAGAMLMGTNTLENFYEMKSNGGLPKWQKGLSMVSYTVLPHYDYVKENDRKLFEKILKESPAEIKANYIGVDENTSLLITDEKDSMVLGSSTVHVFNNGIATVYRAGSFFTL